MLLSGPEDRPVFFAKSFGAPEARRALRRGGERLALTDCDRHGLRAAGRVEIHGEGARTFADGDDGVSDAAALAATRLGEDRDVRPVVSGRLDACVAAHADSS